MTLEKWLVQNLRLTVFSDKSVDIQETPNWWEEITGEIPENKVIRPRENSFREEGSLGNGIFALNIVGRRIDWSWQSIFDPNQESEEVHAIGNFIEASEQFQTWVQKWLETFPTSTRLAFGGVFVLPVSERKAGYTEISRYLQCIDIDLDSREFQYSINRPRLSRSDIPSVEINRLSRWSVSALRKFMIEPGEKGQALGEFNFCRVELDINTSAVYNEIIPNSKSVEVFLELFNLGKEILEKGDIK